MFRKILAGSVALVGIQGSALAGDNLTIQLPLLGYSSTNSEVKPDGGTAAKSAKSGVSTSDLSGGYFQYSLENVQVYVYPFSTAKKVSVGYAMGPIEAGVTLGINTSSVDKPKNETTNNTYGVYGFYMATLGKDLSIESILSIDSLAKSSKVDTVTAGVTTTAETEASGMDIGLSVNVVKGITKHISYVGGFSYVSSTLDNTKPTTAKSKDTSNGLSLNLATFRYAFN